MRAVVCHANGAMDTLKIEEMPAPEMRPDGVRIEVHAAGIQFADNLMVGGTYQRKPPFPFVPGMPVAGKVIETGPEVKHVQPGQSVFAALDWGAWAEEAVAPAATTFAMPEDIDFARAIPFPFAYGTSYAALAWPGRLEAGETMLVHGAAGGVGLAAVEIGKAMGATVLATASTEEKRALAKAHGADHVLPVDDAMRDTVMDLTGGRGVNLVYDPVGEPLFRQSLRCAAPESRILVIGFAGGTVPQIPANILLVKNISVIGFFWSHYRKAYVQRVREAYDRMFGWMREGKIDPVISGRFALDGYLDAMDLILSRKATGQVVLDVRKMS